MILLLELIVDTEEAIEIESLLMTYGIDIVMILCSLFPALLEQLAVN